MVSNHTVIITIINLLAQVKKGFIIILLFLSIGGLNKPIYDLFIKSGVSKL